MKASQCQNYKYVKEIAYVSEFKNYKNFEKYYNQQIEEVRRSATRPDENRFYYTGMLQAVVFDRLMPDWKKEALYDDVYLDDLLRKAVTS